MELLTLPITQALGCADLKAGTDEARKIYFHCRRITFAHSKKLADGLEFHSTFYEGAPQLFSHDNCQKFF